MRILSLGKSLPFLILLGLLSGVAGQRPQTGIETEKRFPPLRLPEGFKATLFACDPFVEYPSAIAAGPRPGSLFVAVDYMTGLGTEIVRRDEIRLIEDTDGDGYADRSTIFARDLNSIMGLAFHDGTLYVMHAPFLTALRDTTGNGVADVRRDLLTGLGLPPEKNPVRLHCANGVEVGHDGWLYLALGDHGVDVKRPEGDCLVLHGGGILRCRTDGTDLHLFASGLRNIYDVALDDELNVFVRDNENDGGAYKIRVCHSFFGADHGYPYLYGNRPQEALPPLADLGLGSSAGGTCYREPCLPAEYRGNLFFCEWGRSVVRYAPQPKGSGFGPVREIEFAVGADNDPYGFKPTDIVVQADGALMVADWCDGQRPKRGRGRIYRITHPVTAATVKPMAAAADIDGELARLDAAGYRERALAQLALEHRGRQGEQAVRQALAGNKLGKRGRLHAVWLLARAAKPNLEDLLHMAGNDPEQAVRIQAIRALADLADPVLVHHRLDAAAADPGLAAKLAALAENAPPAIIREVVIALGRLRWADTPMWLRKHLGAADAVLAHAAMQALRQAGNWPETLKLVDLPNTTPLQGIALRAVAERYELAVVDGLVARLGGQGTASRRSAYAELLARVHRRPGPWEYWGYRPGPRPANSVDWERTAAIQEALDRVVANGDGLLRLATLHAMSLERVPVKLSSLRRWLREERSEAGIAAILESLGEQPATAVREDLASVIVRPQAGLANRLRALALYEAGLDQAGASALLEMVARLEDGPVLAAALPLASKFPQGKAGTLVARHLDSSDGAVRAAALRTLGELGANEGQAAVLRFLDDKQAPVRQAAAFAAGKLRVRASIDVLLKLARDPDAGVRRASLESLGLLREPRVVPLAAEALADHETDLAALGCLRELGGPEQSPRLVELCRRSPSGDVLDTALRILTSWGDRPELDDKVRNQLDRSVADIQGDSGVLLRWHALGPQSAAQAADVVKRIGAGQNCGPNWRRLFASGADPRIQLPGAKNAADAVWLAFSDVALPKETAVEVLGSSGSTLQVWLNGKPVYERKQAAGFRAGSDRFVLTLPAGLSRLLVKVKAAAEPVDVHLRLRRKSASADHERITQAALSRSGNVERGRQVFFNVEKSLCLKCHRVGEQGERIGPELSGVGGRFARVYIVESILEPSRTIAPSFGSIGIVLKSGKVLSGIKLAEDARTLTLADNQGQKHAIMKDDIDEQQPLHASTMPEGLEKRLSEAEFVDLVAFLVSLKAGTSNVKK